MATSTSAQETSTRTDRADAVQMSRSVHSGSFISRLTTGTGAFDLVGRRRYYYMFSTLLVVASILLILLRGFHLGTAFAGGTTFSFEPGAGASQVSQSDVTRVLDQSIGQGNVSAVQTLGGKTVQAALKTLSETQINAGRVALAKAFSPAGGVTGVSASDVSSSWGQQISNRAILAVIIFLVAVGLFIWVRYEKRVAIGAVLSTLHDVLVTAGIYALAGFEVTPATVIGLLTILGFSLYDTVVVYDKVQENSKGLTSLLRRTYPESANLAINQTIMRSLNTSLIAMLPVAGLLVAGIAVVGGGTLKDLALVLLVGMLVGAYSSLFVAVPIAVDLKIREPGIKNHTARVLAKRRADGLIVDADGDPVGRKTLPGSEPARFSSGAVTSSPTGLKAGAPPKPGVKPRRQGRAAPNATVGSKRPPSVGSTPLSASGRGASGQATSGQGTFDSALSDTGVAGTALSDTGVAGTALSDTGLAGTALSDTGVAGTALSDTGFAGTDVPAVGSGRIGSEAETSTTGAIPTTKPSARPPLAGSTPQPVESAQLSQPEPTVASGAKSPSKSAAAGRTRRPAAKVARPTGKRGR